MPSKSKFLFVFLCICVIGFSQSITAKNTDTSDNEILVERNRKIETGIASGAGAASIINMNRWRGAYRELSEVLEREAGIHIKRYGGLGSYSTLSVRGSAANQVRIYLDGIPLTSASTGEVNLSDLNISGIEKIEIYRSVAPIYLGGPSSAGAVNIITRKKKRGKGGKFRILAGSQKTAGASGLIWGGQLIPWTIRGAYKISDQNFIFQNDNGTPLLTPWDDFDDRRRNAQFRDFALGGDLSFKHGKTEIILLDDFIQRRSGVPGPSSNQTEKSERKYIRNSLGVAGDTKEFLAEFSRLKTLAYYYDSTTSFLDPRQEFSSGAPNSRSRIRRYGTNLMPALYFPAYGHIIRFLIGSEKEEFTRDRRNQIDVLIEKLPNKSRHRTSARIEEEFRAFRKRLIITGAARYDRYINRFNQSSSLYGSFYQPDLERQSDPRNEFADYSIGIRALPYRTPVSKIFIRSSFSRDRRMPTFFELFGERGSVIGNPELNPESIRQGELGIGYERILNRNLILEFSAIGFAKRIEDMILLLPNSQFTLRAENIAAADIRGAELDARIRWKKSIELRINYAYLQAINRSEIEELNGKYLPLLPRHEAHSELLLRRGPFELGLQVDFIGAVFQDKTNEYQAFQEARIIYGMHLRWNIKSEMKRERKRKYKGENKVPTTQSKTFAGDEQTSTKTLQHKKNEVNVKDGKGFSVILEIKNLSNQRLEGVAGYPLPGRTAYLAGEWRF